MYDYFTDCMEPNGDSELTPEEQIAELKEELGHCYETIAYLKEEGLIGTLIKRMREIERLKMEVATLTKLLGELKGQTHQAKAENICTYSWYIQAGTWVVRKLVKFFARKK